MAAVDYRKLLTAAIFVDVVLLLVMASLKDIELGINFSTLSMVGSLAGLNWAIWGLFKKWLWKWKILQGWLVKIPDLSGVWAGTMVSTWKNPETGEGVPPIKTQAVITQHLTKLNIDFTTNEMGSKSVVADLNYDSLRRVAEINYIYQSVPDASVRGRSAIHYGAAQLEVKKTQKKIMLKGNYWTDRSTTGNISLSRVG